MSDDTWLKIGFVLLIICFSIGIIIISMILDQKSNNYCISEGYEGFYDYDCATGYSIIVEDGYVQCYNYTYNNHLRTRNCFIIER